MCLGHFETYREMLSVSLVCFPSCAASHSRICSTSDASKGCDGADVGLADAELQSNDASSGTSAGAIRAKQAAMLRIDWNGKCDRPPISSAEQLGRLETLPPFAAQQTGHACRGCPAQLEATSKCRHVVPMKC